MSATSGLRAIDIRSRDLPDKERLDFERLFLYLRLCFFVAPLLLIVSYGSRAFLPALQAEVAVACDCLFVAVLLRGHPDWLLRWQILARVLDLGVAYVALHFVHFFQHNAYYDSVYLFFVVAATATHGRHGNWIVAALSVAAVFVGRMQLIQEGAFRFETRHVTDAAFYGLLFFVTGAITQFLMKRSGEVVEMRDREAREAVQRSEARYRGLFENATDIVYEHDSAGFFTAVNRQGRQLLGYGNGELLGVNLLDIVDPTYVKDARLLIESKSSDDGNVHVELVLLTKDGMSVPVEVSCRALYDEERGKTVQGIARDITERKFMENQLRHQALHDALTGLPNRFLFEDRLHSAITVSRRSGDTLALLLFDLDGFKQVNDTFGHAIGDALLREKASRTTAILRDSDTVARIGGDEFALLLPHTNAEGASLVAEKLSDIVREAVTINGKTLSVGASIGIALYPDTTRNIDDLKEQADRAMYRAKRAKTRYALAS